MKEAARPRLAIVSSWNVDCGNASYTYALKKEFEKYYDVEVLGLDLHLLLRDGKKFRALARRHIAEMAQRLKEFDYVNLQFEAGLYGANNGEILDNIKTLMDAAPNLILTMHRVDVHDSSLSREVVFFIKNKFSLKVLRQRRWLLSSARLYRGILKHAKHLSTRKSVWVKVHTKRERRLISEILNFKNVIDAPLAFLDDLERGRVQSDVRPSDLRRRYSLPPEAKILGAFGYIVDYKGFEDLIRAIRVMPDNWYLLIAGSQHPMSIKPWKPIDPYLKKLLALATSGPLSCEHRLRFIGNVDDNEFTFLLRNVDAVVLPYIEVGQSMSGIVALAVESGARLFCSNNLSFAEVRRYYGDAFGRFDIGNHIEIAHKVLFDDTDRTIQRAEVYKNYNIASLVRLHRDIFEGRTGTLEARH